MARHLRRSDPRAEGDGSVYQQRLRSDHRRRIVSAAAQASVDPGAQGARTMRPRSGRACADRGSREATSPLSGDPIARRTAAGTVELAEFANARARVGSRAEDGCGNDTTMEITERFPQPLLVYRSEEHRHKPETRPRATRERRC